MGERTRHLHVVSSGVSCGEFDMLARNETEADEKVGELSSTQTGGVRSDSTDPGRRLDDGATIADGVDAEAEGLSTDRSEPAPSAVTDPTEFARALVEAGLFDAEELKPFTADPSKTLGELAQALVDAGKLTAYQAAAVCQGKSRGLLIGRYVILDKLGVGGMGIVFKARHRVSGAVGALKILPPSLARDKKAVVRFRREIEAAGRVRHPNLVAAIDADEDRGVHFLVMECVEGRDLARVVREKGRLPVNQAIDYVIQAARGIEAAHARGIVHRDIKPSNLMLDATGTVRVLDLGLARVASAYDPFGQAGESAVTKAGTYMGTADYVAPEQAEDSHGADHRADIYSLGCTLYYLITGEVPFPAKTILKRMMAHAERPAPSLCAGRPEVPRALDAVFQKMMAKRPDDRPWSMTDLIALLEPCKVATATASVAKERPKLLVFDEAPRKPAAPPKSDPNRPIPALPETPQADLVGPELDLNALDDLAIEDRNDSVLAEELESSYAVRSTAYSVGQRGRFRRSRFNGRLAAVATGLVALIWLLGLTVYRLATNTGDLVIETDRADVGVVVKQDGKVTRIIDTKTRNRVTLDAGSYELSLKNEPAGLRISPETVTLKRGDTVRATVERVRTVQLPEETREPARGERVAIRPKAAPSGDASRSDVLKKEVMQPKAERVGEIRRFEGHEGEIIQVALSRDGRLALSGSADRTARLWDVASGKELKKLEGHFGQVDAVAFSPDGSRVLTAGEDHRLRLCDVASGKILRRFRGHTAHVTGVAFAPDGRRALSSSLDHTLLLWDLGISKPLRTFEGHTSGVQTVAYAPDGHRAVSGGLDLTVRIWDVDALRELRKLKGHFAPVRAVAYSTDGRRLLSGAGDGDGTLRLWESETGRALDQFTGIYSGVESVAFSPDGRRALFAGADHGVHLLNLLNGQIICTLEGHTDRVTSVVFARDGRHAISGSHDKTLRLWRLPEG
jgi:WD40 repeat protein/serine/threonine protein kinase